MLRSTYEAFQELLTFDSRCHELMAELEGLYYRGQKEDFSRISQRYDELAHNVKGMVEGLATMAPTSHLDLPAYFRKFDFYCRFLLAPPEITITPPYVLSLANDSIDQSLSGAKTSSLVELREQLGLAIPAGFVITVNSFSYLLEFNDLRPKIKALLAQIDLTDP